MRRRESDEEGRGENDSPWPFCARRCSRSPSVSGRLASLVEEMPQGQAQAWQHIAAVQIVARRQHPDLGCRCVRIDLHLDGIQRKHKERKALRLIAIRQARLKPLASSSSGHARRKGCQERMALP